MYIIGSRTQSLLKATREEQNSFAEITCLNTDLDIEVARDLMARWLRGDEEVSKMPKNIKWHVCKSDFMLMEKTAGIVFIPNRISLIIYNNIVWLLF